MVEYNWGDKGGQQTKKPNETKQKTPINNMQGPVILATKI